MNKTQSNNTGNTHLLTFPVIVAATNGDVDAINTVMKHYEGYIIALSTRRLTAETAAHILAWTRNCAARWKRN